MTKVSVVVVTCNRHQDCRETLDSLLVRQTAEPYEVVIVDCSREPFSYKHRLVCIIRTDTKISLGAARNIGIKATRGNTLAFIDDDALATRDWVAEISGAFNHDIAILGGPVEPIYFAHPPRWSALPEFQIIVGISKDHLIGCNMVMRRELFEKVGYFRSSLGRKAGALMSNEESDFINRAQKLGVKPQFSPTLRVLHKVYPYRLTFPYLIKRLFWQGISEYVMLHSEAGRLRLLVWSGFQALSCCFRMIVPKGTLSQRRMRTFLLLITALGRLLGPGFI